MSRTLDTIAAQECRDFAVVLVDNDSTDATLDVINRWAAESRVTGLDTKVVSEPTPGAAAARNRGLREVTTPWVMFFDSDDIMSPGHIGRITDAITTHPRADIIGWDVRLRKIDGTTGILPFEPRDAVFHNLFHGTMSTQRYCVTTSLVRKVGGWSPAVRAWDDIELGTRILLASPRPVILRLGGEITVHQLSTVESITGTAESRNAVRYEQALAAIKKSLPQPKSHLVELKRVILAACCYREGEVTLAREMLNRALAATPRRLHRLLWRAAYHYTRRGGRGIARILKGCI